MTFSPQLEERFAKLLTRYPAGRNRSAVIPMLMYAQDEVGSITRDLIDEVAKRCGVTPLQVDEVVGYYSMLHRKPLGKFHVQVCTNISCLLVGGEELYDETKDPYEWTNLARDAGLMSKREDLAKWLPKENKADIGKERLAGAEKAGAKKKRKNRD